MLDLVLFALRWPAALLLGALAAGGLAVALQGDAAQPWTTATLYGVLTLGVLTALAAHVALSAIATRRGRRSGKKHDDNGDTP